MKVCFWHTRFHPIYSGHVLQTDLVRRYLKANPDATDLEMILWTLQWDKTVPTEAVHEGIRVRRFGPPGPEKWKYYARHLNFLRAVVTEHKDYDILHLNGPNHLTRLAFLPAHLMGKKVIVHMTLMGSDDPLSLREGPFPWLYRYFQEKVDCWISISKGLTDAYHASGLALERLREIPIAVECERFSAAPDKGAVRRALGLPEGRPMVVSVGHVIKRKGYDLLIEAAAEVVKSVPDALFVIVGPTEVLDPAEEPLADWIRQRVETLGIQQNVLMIGRSNQVQAYMQAADVFAFATRREGFGIVALEAAATELPVVMFDLEGISCELVEEGATGFVVPMEDTGAFAERLVRLLGNPALCARMGKRGRERALARFEVKNIAQQYLRMYREVCGKA